MLEEKTDLELAEMIGVQYEQLIKVQSNLAALREEVLRRKALLPAPAAEGDSKAAVE